MLRALIWPEHLERHQQLIDAAAEFEHDDIRMHAGDASRGALPPLPSVISVASRDGIDLDPVDLANPDQLLWLRA